MSDAHRTMASREALRATHLAMDRPLVQRLIAVARLDESARRRIHLRALLLAGQARRNAEHEGFALKLVHRFGLNTPHGIALMQLAEALPRTTDAESARLLIADKLGALTWRDAVGGESGFRERLALHALDTLSKTFRDARSDSTLQRVAHASLQKAIAVLSRQYVLGETIDDAVRRGRALSRPRHGSANGYRFSYDMLGEAALTETAALAFQQSYLHAIDTLGNVMSAKHARGEHAISVKLSALHPRFEERQRATTLPLLVERIKCIAVRARTHGLQLTIDAEESERLELTLDVFASLLAAPELAGWDGLGLAVQAYQRRALAVVDYLGTLAAQHNRRINVRLVKGAYWDTEIKRAQQLGLTDYPVFVRKCDTDVSYLACARRLLEQPTRFFAQFATHNAHTVAAMTELAEQTANRHFEFQRLHGMGEHIHDALLREGHVSRIYAPIGPRRDLLPYLVRRLLENGASSSFVRQLTDTSLSLESLVRDPQQEAELFAPAVVTTPRDVQGQVWPTAQGYDLAARPTSDELLAALKVSQQSGAPVTTAMRVIFNPASRDEVIGHIADATIASVPSVVAVAHDTYAQWAATSASLRAQMLERAAQLLEQRAAEFMQLAVCEAGKTLDDAIGEVREAVDFCRYYAEQCRLPAMQGRESLGVIACISPWNFPLAIFLGQVTAALAAGNTVVAKPAEQTPLIALLATRLLHEAGIPQEALQLLIGDGQIGAALVSHADIKGVCFTGSMATAKAINHTLAASGRAALPFIAETGGINAMIVDSSALPEQVVRDVLASAFQSAGQRCSALRVLCLQEDIADHVLALLCGALDGLCVGDPRDLATDVGPLIDAEAQQQVLAYLANKKTTAAARLDPAIAARGFFVAPTLIEVARIVDVQREVFGPVLHIARFAARNFPAVVNEINQLGFGLTLGIHSRIRRRVHSIIEAVHIGNVYVNRHQVGAVVGQQPFGGHGLSGTGPKAGGPHYLLRVSRCSAPPPLALSVSHPSVINFIAVPLNRQMTTTTEQVRAAQSIWAHTRERSEKIQFACALLSANSSHPISGVAYQLRLPSLNHLHLRLAAIAGEENTLRLRPRGVLLCLSFAESLETVAAQILMAVATGNGVVALVQAAHLPALHDMIAELHQAGMPDRLIACIDIFGHSIPAAWLTQLAIDGVIFDGPALGRQRVAEQLASRSGAILPLLCSTDDVYRYCLEQTVTLNTAAAGGDPRLLGIATHVSPLGTN